jgi:hypothetical protein
MVQIRAGRALGNTEHRPNFTVREPLHIVQDDHGSLPIGEVRECLTQSTAKFVGFTRIPEGSG